MTKCKCGKSEFHVACANCARVYYDEYSELRKKYLAARREVRALKVQVKGARR